MSEPKKIPQVNQEEQSFENEDTLKIIIEELARQGYEVEKAKDGGEEWDFVSPDLEIPSLTNNFNLPRNKVLQKIVEKTSVSKESKLEAHILPLDEIDRVVDEIANKTNESKIEALRKAMCLMKIVIQAKEHGYKFGLTKDSKVLDSEISL